MRKTPMSPELENLDNAFWPVLASIDSIYGNAGGAWAAAMNNTFDVPPDEQVGCVVRTVETFIDQNNDGYGCDLDPKDRDVLLRILKDPQFVAAQSKIIER